MLSKPDICAEFGRAQNLRRPITNNIANKYEKQLWSSFVNSGTFQYD